MFCDQVIDNEYCYGISPLSFCLLYNYVICFVTDWPICLVFNFKIPNFHDLPNVPKKDRPDLVSHLDIWMKELNSSAIVTVMQHNKNISVIHLKRFSY